MFSVLKWIIYRERRIIRAAVFQASGGVFLGFRRWGGGGGGVKVICRYEVMKSCDRGRPFRTSYYFVLHPRSFCALSVDKAIDIDYDK